jgi:protein-S-isoprenylcysteine O-methyltransferase Ste14
MGIKKSIRLLLGYILGVLFLFLAKPSLASMAGGAVFVALGETLRFVSAGTLRKYKGVVSRNGIYAFTRNPLYIGSFIMGTGFCIIGRDPAFFILFLFLFIPVYHRVIKREEAYLSRQYGEEYHRYCTSVPRLIPRTFDIRYIFRESSAAKSFNNKEGKTLLGIAAVFAVMVMKLYFR